MMGSVGISSSVSAVLQGLECVFFFGGGGWGVRGAEYADPKPRR